MKYEVLKQCIQPEKHDSHVIPSIAAISHCPPPRVRKPSTTNLTSTPFLRVLHHTPWRRHVFFFGPASGLLNTTNSGHLISLTHRPSGNNFTSPFLPLSS